MSNTTPGAEPSHLPAEANESPVADDATEVDATPTPEMDAASGGAHTRTGAFVRSPLLVGALLVGLVAGAVGGVSSSAILYGSQPSASTPVTGSSSASASTATTGGQGIKTTNALSQSDLSKIINTKLPSIVTIGVVGGGESGTGSGVVINKQGYIVTNAHVATLEGATAAGSITVQTSTGNTYKATLVGYDATADVAVIRIAADAKGIAPVTFASSANLKVGSTTIAIGSPLGLSGTVTTGIISALNRPILVQSAAVGSSSSNYTGSSTVALSAIQTDAAINQGNSGGALLDQEGNLIGLNDAIATAGDSTGSIGIGFAIPGDYVKRIAQEIITNGKGQHGYLGASLSDYTPSGASFEAGARVNSTVSGQAAAKAGLAAGDVLTRINDTTVVSSTQATAFIKQQMPGTKITVTYTRGGVERTAVVTLGNLPSS